MPIYSLPIRTLLLPATVFLQFLLSAVAFGETPRQAPVTLATYLQSLGFAPAELKKVQTSYFLLDARVNGNRVRFKVDTGAPLTALDVGKAAGIKTLGELHLKLKDSFLGILSDPSILLVDELSVGGARFTHQPVRKMALDSDYITLGFGGIIGLDFLYRNFCILDCGAQRLYFHGGPPTAEQTSAIAQSLRNGGYNGVPIFGRRRLRLEIDSQVNQQPFAWMLDTGAVFSLMEESERISLKLPTIRLASTGSFLPLNVEGQVVGFKTGGLGDHQAKVVSLPTLAIGPRTWERVNVAVTDLKPTDFDRTAEAIHLHGMLGSNFLVDEGAIIDFSSQTLWFRRPRAQR